MGIVVGNPIPEIQWYLFEPPIVWPLTWNLDPPLWIFWHISPVLLWPARQYRPIERSTALLQMHLFYIRV